MFHNYRASAIKLKSRGFDVVYLSRGERIFLLSATDDPTFTNSMSHQNVTKSISREIRLVLLLGDLHFSWTHFAGAGAGIFMYALNMMYSSNLINSNVCYWSNLCRFAVSLWGSWSSNLLEYTLLIQTTYPFAVFLWKRWTSRMAI